MARRKSKGPSKLQLVRESLAAGIEKPTDIVEHIKKLGTDMSTGQVSNYKSLLKREGASTNGRKKPRGRRRMAQVASTGPRHQFASPGLVRTLLRLKEVVRDLGVEETKKLVDVLA
jgi:hypothetical protein